MVVVGDIQFPHSVCNIYGYSHSEIFKVENRSLLVWLCHILRQPKRDPLAETQNFMWDGSLAGSWKG